MIKIEIKNMSKKIMQIQRIQEEFKIKRTKEDKEGHYVIIRGKAIINVNTNLYAVNNIAAKYIKQGWSLTYKQKSLGGGSRKAL